MFWLRAPKLLPVSRFPSFSKQGWTKGWWRPVPTDAQQWSVSCLSRSQRLRQTLRTTKKRSQHFSAFCIRLNTFFLCWMIGWCWDMLGILDIFLLMPWGGEQCGRSRWSLAQWLVAQMQMQFRLFHCHRQRSSMCSKGNLSTSGICHLISPGSLVSVARAGTSVLQWVAKKVLLDPTHLTVFDMHKDESSSISPGARTAGWTTNRASATGAMHTYQSKPIETNEPPRAGTGWTPALVLFAMRVIHVNVLLHGQICHSLALVWSCLINMILAKSGHEWTLWPWPYAISQLLLMKTDNAT